MTSFKKFFLSFIPKEKKKIFPKYKKKFLEGHHHGENVLLLLKI